METNVRLYPLVHCKSTVSNIGHWITDTQLKVLETSVQVCHVMSRGHVDITVVNMHETLRSLPRSLPPTQDRQLKLKTTHGLLYNRTSLLLGTWPLKPMDLRVLLWIYSCLRHTPCYSFIARQAKIWISTEILLAFQLKGRRHSKCNTRMSQEIRYIYCPQYI